MARKTVKIKDVLSIVNRMLEHDYDLSQMTPAEEKAFRQGAAWLAEGLLHKADAYNGFSYTEKAGLERDPETCHCKSIADESRRHYY